MLALGSKIGILGAGQLGRFLAQAALKLGYQPHIYGPNGLAPAFQASRLGTVGDFDDLEKLKKFAGSVDLITFEFESIPVDTIDFLSEIRPVFPRSRALKLTQDRLIEKQFITETGLVCAPYAAFETATELEKALKQIGSPAIAKRRLMGYDGHGQKLIRSQKDASEAAQAFDGIPSILEKLIPFDREISVVLARTVSGEIAAYPVVENRHERQILSKSQVPARLSPVMEAKAKVIAARLASALDFVGVLAVEMFVIEADNQILVNEIAPRVHNSGHWTIEGAVTSQFEQHIRAITGLRLGNTEAMGAIEMYNLLGDDVGDIEKILEDPKAHYHNYGKDPIRPGRKTGHVTRVLPFAAGESAY